MFVFLSCTVGSNNNNNVCVRKNLSSRGQPPRARRTKENVATRSKAAVTEAATATASQHTHPYIDTLLHRHTQTRISFALDLNIKRVRRPPSPYTHTLRCVRVCVRAVSLLPVMEIYEAYFILLLMALMPAQRQRQRAAQLIAVCIRL